MEIKIEKSNLENDVEMHLTEAANGWIVKGCSTRGEDNEFVFKTLKEVKNNLESIYSVLKQDPKQITEEDLDEEEERLAEKEEK